MVRLFRASVFAACFVPGLVTAQAGANAVAGARDAFGFRSGDDSIGIYDETFIRGFSPEAGGNYRFNGAYFVRNSGTSHYFVESATVRVGYNTLGLPLPNASGFVDYKLRDPATNEKDSLTVGSDPYGQTFIDLHLKSRSDDEHASASIGLSRVLAVKDAQGGDGGGSWLAAGAGRWSSGSLTARAFFGEYEYERPSQFKLRVNPDAPPAPLAREEPIVPSWATDRGQRRIVGGQVEWAASENTGVRQTIVWSQEDPSRTYTQLMAQGENLNQWYGLMVGTPEQQSQSLSSELDAYREFDGWDMPARLDILVRTRRSTAAFGGSAVSDVAMSPYGEQPAEPEAPLVIDEAPLSHQVVDQWGIGAAGNIALLHRLSLYSSVMLTDYEKTVEPASGQPTARGVSSVMHHLGLTWSLGRDSLVYLSKGRGLEEAGVAPTTATNRNAILDAIDVDLKEIGAKVSLNGGMTLVGGVFEISKPYAGLNPGTSVYEEIATVTHRGIEASLTGKIGEDVRLIAGGVLIDATLDRYPSIGELGRHPAGVPRARGVLGLDYSLSRVQGMSLDSQLTYQGNRAATLILSDGDDQLDLPSATTLNFGARYRRQVGDSIVTLRAQMLNLTDEFHWDTAGGETLSYSAPRRYRFACTYEF